MLVKWAVEGKRRSRLDRAFRIPHIDNDSICTAPSSDPTSDPISLPRSSEDDQTPAMSKEPQATDRSEGRMRLQRLFSEEHAIILLDEKLMAASNPNPRHLSISMPPTPSSRRSKLPTPALTFENMALLNREFEVNPFDLLDYPKATDNDSGSDGSIDGCKTPEEDIPIESRGELWRNPSSEFTVRLGTKQLCR